MQAPEKQYWCCLIPPARRSTDDWVRDGGRAGSRGAGPGVRAAWGWRRRWEAPHGPLEAGRTHPGDASPSAAAQARLPPEPAGRGGEERPDPPAPSPGTLPAPL